GRARDRQGSQRARNRYHARPRRYRRARRARTRRRDPPGNAHFSGAADLRQRRAFRTCPWARRRRTPAQAGRPPRRCVVSFAGRPHRQEFPQRAWPCAGLFAPSAGSDGGATNLPPAHAQARNTRRHGNRRQPARPLSEAAGGGAHRGFGPHDAGRGFAAAAAFARRRHAGALMILRVLNLVVIGALILAAAYVYRIKYDSTVQAERLAKIRSEVRREREAIAALRAEWGELETPTRIEALTKRYLHLKPIAPTQFDKLNALPEQPPQLVKPDSRDPIGEVIENLEEPPAAMTGSVWPPMAAPQAAAAAAAADAMPVPIAPAAPVMTPPVTPA